MKYRSSHRHAQVSFRRRTASAARLQASPRQLVRALAACSLLTLWPGAAELRAQVLPSGMNTVAGQVATRTVGGTLTVNNSPNAIINWNSFSIGASNAVRFEQVNARSQVLNRVTGNDPSAILGSLSSNGRVWLLNPNGVLFGQSARVDVAGLVTSTLNLNNADWLAGDHRFEQGTGKPAGIINQGELRSSLGGRIALIGATVRNEGEINAPGGQVLMAAGSSVELVDSMTPNVSVRLNAGAGEAVNLGRLMAAGGRIDVHAGTVNQSGIVRADSLSAGPGGEIVLQATDRLSLAAASQTSAIGAGGQGGKILLLGREVGLLDTARVDASGSGGGGEVLVGGGRQGKDPGVPNAQAVYFGPKASIAADAMEAGAGGRVILWSDKATRAYGSVSARGGASAGNGGFIETSGGWLDARPRKLDLSAAKGSSGQWLLDPFDLTINDAGPDTGYDPVSFTANANGSTISTGVIQGQLELGNSVTISTGGAAGGQAGNISMANATLSVNSSGPGDLTLIADGGISMTGSTIQSLSARMNVSLLASRGGDGGITLQNASIVSRGGDITLGGFGAGIGVSGSFANAAISNSSYGIRIDNSTLNAGSGRLSGKLSLAGASGALAGVSLSSASVWQARNITINGSSTATNGVEIPGASLTTLAAITVEGVGAQSGVVLSAGSSMLSSDPVSGSSLLSLVGSSLGNANGVLVAGDLTAGNGNSVSVSASNAGGPTPALLVTGNITVGSPGSLKLAIDNPAIDNSIVVNGSTLSGSAGGILIVGASSLTLRDTKASAQAIELWADQIDFEGTTSLSASRPFGDVLMLTNRNNGPLSSFTNNSTIGGLGGPDALQTSGGRWIIWASDIASAAFKPGSLPYDFTLYGAADSSAWSGFPGNGYASSSAGVASVVATINPRVYDTTTTVVLQSPLQATGPRGEVASFSSPPGVQFADKNVGRAKPVELVGGFTVSFTDGLGKPAFGLTLTSGMAGDITPATILLQGLSGNTKTYDATTAATYTGVASVTPLGSDDVSVLLPGGAPASFADKNVGNAKPITISSMSLTGVDAANYVLNTSSLTANILPFQLSLSGATVNNKVYDATLNATFGGTPSANFFAGDNVALTGGVARFTDKTVGTNKPVRVNGFGLSGTDAGNYLAPLTTLLTADITPATLRYAASPVKQSAGLAIPPLTGSVEGFVAGETLQTATTGSLGFTTLATSTSAPGQYAVLGSGLGATNYIFVQDAANATALTLNQNSADVIVTTKIVDAAPKQALQLMVRPVQPADPALGGV